MGILDSSGIKRLQENLLGKGDQNRALTLDLARTTAVAKYIAMVTGFDFIDRFTNVIEDNQVVIRGWSREQFLKSLENVRPEESTELGEKE